MDDFYAECKYTTYFNTCTQLEKYMKENEYELSAHYVLYVTQVVLPNLTFNGRNTCWKLKSALR